MLSDMTYDDRSSAFVVEEVQNVAGNALTFPTPPSHNAALVYLASLYSSESRRTMRSKLNCIARMIGRSSLVEVDWEHLRFTDVLGIMVRLESTCKGSTVNNYLAALKGVAHKAWSLGLMDKEDFLRIRDVKPRRYSREATGRSLSFEESFKVATGGHGPNEALNVRDDAILHILLGCGLRREELCALMMSNYDPAGPSLKLVGKGNKERTVYLPPEAKVRLELWIRDWRGNEDGPIFGKISRYGRLSLKSNLNPRTIGRILEGRLRAEGLERATPHDLRRTFATRLIEAGNDIVAVQRAMGHASVETTARYDRRGEEAQRSLALNVRI